MLIACMHMATHRTNPYYVRGEAHHDPDRLVWLADVHLIAGRLSGQDWEQLVTHAGAKGLRQVTLQGLRRAQALWHTSPPEFVLRALSAPGPFEPASDYLASTGLRQQWLDFCAIEGLARKLGFLGELLFPSRAYMQARFGASAAFLPWLYVKRAAGGIIKRLGAPKPR
jgi:hypothetical protein